MESTIPGMLVTMILKFMAGQEPAPDLAPDLKPDLAQDLDLA
jgi:hypothetical protein